MPIIHFIGRGLLLILLQFVLINRAWEFSPGGWRLNPYIGVLYALGGTMILGSFLLWLQPKAILALTMVLFLGMDGINKVKHPIPSGVCSSQRISI